MGTAFDDITAKAQQAKDMEEQMMRKQAKNLASLTGIPIIENSLVAPNGMVIVVSTQMMHLIREEWQMH